MDYIVAISIDGLPIRAVEENSDTLPNLLKLKDTSFSTHNARTDYNLTITMPNHMSMITSRPVYDNKRCKGHNLIRNRKIDQTVKELNGGEHVFSLFEVLSDNKVPYGVYLNKTKLEILCRSFHVPEEHCFINEDYDSKSIYITKRLLEDLKKNKYKFYFIHFAGTDNMGHHHGWDSSQYLKALQYIDHDIGLIMKELDNKPNNAIILTTDHGGHGTNHGDSTNKLNFTIPFYLKFSNQECKDLYCFVERQRKNTYKFEYEELEPEQKKAIEQILKGIPNEKGNLYDLLGHVEPKEDDNPKYEAVEQPIRNGLLGNLVTRLLFLPLIDEACIA